MPWKNPQCPKCHAPAGHGVIKQIKWLGKAVSRGTGYSDGMEYGRVVFKCKSCGHEFEGWGHRRIKKFAR